MFEYDLIGKRIIESCKTINQSETVLLTGQSGAGKSENTKHLLDYICFGLTTDAWKSRLKSLNPVLELFGNARTNNNDNSSRFIKFIKVSSPSKKEKVYRSIILLLHVCTFIRKLILS